MPTSDYRYFLSITSQFHFCPIPFRLDSYSSCSFGCRYCYASCRGGQRGDSLQIASPETLLRRISRSKASPPQSALDDFLARRIPLHFGSMSDPFSDFEKQHKTSLQLLKVLNSEKYPTIISTKSSLLTQDNYLEVISEANCIVQVSITSLDDSIKTQLEPGTPPSQSIKQTIATLIKAGVPISLRFQPFIEALWDQYISTIDWFSGIGGQHIAIEYLKIPIEKKWHGQKHMSDLLRKDIKNEYLERGATRVGREWVLPLHEKLDHILKLKHYANSKGLYVGVAENELSLLSDGDCCCFHDISAHLSGANLFEYNFRKVAKDGLKKTHFGLDSLNKVWAPEHSIRMYINSHSRKSDIKTIRDYIKQAWNGTHNGFSICEYYGIEFHDSPHQTNRYHFQDDAKSLYEKHRFNPKNEF